MATERETRARQRIAIAKGKAFKSLSALELRKLLQNIREEEQERKEALKSKRILDKEVAAVIEAFDLIPNARKTVEEKKPVLDWNTLGITEEAIEEERKAQEIALQKYKIRKHHKKPAMTEEEREAALFEKLMKQAREEQGDL